MDDSHAPHELEFAVRGDEADRPVRVEFVELDALVELAIVQLDPVVFRCSQSADLGAIPIRHTLQRHDTWTRAVVHARLAEDQLVVETELAFRRPGEIRSHQDLAVDVGSKYRACKTLSVRHRSRLMLAQVSRTFCRHDQVDGLDDIHKRFVLAVLDIGFSPRRRTRRLDRNL